MNTQQIVLASRPVGTPTHDNFRFENIELPDIQDGEVLLQGLYYSVDPYMRGRMNDAKSYVAPFEVDQPISGTDAVISNINFHARIPLCGQISLYNSTETPVGPRLQPMLLTRSVLMQGFIVSNFQSEFPEGINHLAKWLKEGKLKFEQTTVHGFDQLPTALLGLFKGSNIGKMIVAV